MDKPKLYVCSFSGGKDSTAMLLRLLEEGMPVDIILFCDTGLEFPQLYRHVDKVEHDIGREITRVKAPHDFEYYFAEVKVKRKENTTYARKYGLERDGYGWAGPKMRWCTEELNADVESEQKQRIAKRGKLTEYLETLRNQGLISSFNETLWYGTVEQVRVTTEGNLHFIFRDGQEITV